jgi:hypothetical protein
MADQKKIHVEYCFLCCINVFAQGYEAKGASNFCGGCGCSYAPNDLEEGHYTESEYTAALTGGDEDDDFNY